MVADVGVVDERAAAPLVDAGGRLLEVLPAAGVDGHVAAGVGQGPCDGPPDASPRPCHDRHLPVEAELLQQAHT